MSTCVVDLHVDAATGQWWAHCGDCHFGAAAATLAELRALVRTGHPLAYRLDLCVDNQPPVNASSSTEVDVIDWSTPEEVVLPVDETTLRELYRAVDALPCLDATTGDGSGGQMVGKYDVLALIERFRSSP